MSYSLCLLRSLCDPESANLLDADRLSKHPRLSRSSASPLFAPSCLRGASLDAPAASCYPSPITQGGDHESKTFRYLEHGGLEIFEVDVPPPGPGEVQVKGEVCGICAWDLNTFKLGRAGGHPPAPAGHEGSHTVVALGEGVAGLAWATAWRAAALPPTPTCAPTACTSSPAETSIP
jgi:hypothetical protein